MPREDDLYPFVYDSKTEFGKNCDYYFEGIDGRWTNLEIYQSDRVSGIPESTFSVNVYYAKNQNYESCANNITTLKAIASSLCKETLEEKNINNIAVGSIGISTSSTKIYKMFLHKVLFLLNHTRGFIVNTPRTTFNGSFIEWCYLDNKQFSNEFIK